MSMSRKDFSMVAKVLGRANAHNHNASQIIHAITEELTNEYPNFSPSRFLDACGMGDILPSKEHYPIQVPKNQVLMVDDSPQEDSSREVNIQIQPRTLATLRHNLRLADERLDMEIYPEEVDMEGAKHCIRQCLDLLSVSAKV